VSLLAELESLLVAVGQAIAKLHDGGLVHGDLTTSNMMLREADKQLVRWLTPAG
jgi:TP53 regulating kinase-like protein